MPPMMRGRKRCLACEATKPRAAFQRRAASPDGIDSYCRHCRRAYRRTWNAAHRGHSLAYLRKYRDKNRERLRTYFREYQRRRRALMKAGKWTSAVRR
jgi:hypothetical protein